MAISIDLVMILIGNGVGNGRAVYAVTYGRLVPIGSGVFIDFLVIFAKRRIHLNLGDFL